MDGLAFLKLLLLINHQIPHVPLELYECRFWTENEGQSYPLIQGAKTHPIKCLHASITWIGGPTNLSKPMYIKASQYPEESRPTD